MKLWSGKTIRYTICLVFPVVFSPLAASPYKESKCAYVVLCMAVFWMLEPIHLTVTALMPIPLMPLLGILSGAEVCGNYMKEVLMMFLGGLAVAVAVEHSRLHERIALKVLLSLGSDTKRLMLGFMLTTMFLSMWISNTATTAMMVPIVDAVMTELRQSITKKEDPVQHESSATALNLDVLQKTLFLSIAYAANCGGTGTMTGTSPNMIFKGILEELHPKSNEITYASWMAYNVPGMIMCVLMGWIVLQVLYVPCWRKQDDESKARVRQVIASRYKELGKISFHEAAVLILFVILVFLWIFREPKFMRGWADLIGSGVHIGDAVPVIAILFLLFLIPARPWEVAHSPRLLEWPVVQAKLPWGLVFLLGGGFALAHGTQKSGLSKWLGEAMTEMSVLPPVAVLVILCAVTAALTEIITNSTVATILLPVVSQMAMSFKVNPLYLMLPVTIASSYAFMLPVATGPNAIVFESSQMNTIDMVKPGIIMNIVSCCIQLMMINTLGVTMFDLNTFPAWANNTVLNQSSTFNGLIELNHTTNGLIELNNTTHGLIELNATTIGLNESDLII